MRTKLIDINKSEEEFNEEEKAILDHFAFYHNIDPILIKSHRPKFYRWLKNGIPKKYQENCQICNLN
jgi:hypothetical protein